VELVAQGDAAIGIGRLLEVPHQVDVITLYGGLANELLPQCPRNVSHTQTQLQREPADALRSGYRRIRIRRVLHRSPQLFLQRYIFVLSGWPPCGAKTTQSLYPVRNPTLD